MRNPAGVGWVRSVIAPSDALPTRKSATSIASGGSFAGSTAGDRPTVLPAPAPAGRLRQSTRWNRPVTGAPSASGTRTLPASAVPCAATSVAPAPGCTCSRVSGNSEPSSRNREADTSMLRSASGLPRLPSPRVTAIHSSASSTSACPVATSPDGGGASATVPLPSTTRTPVCIGPAAVRVLRARTPTRLPRPTLTSPSPSGSAMSIDAGSDAAVALRNGAGKPIVVPTRSECSCRRVGPGLAPETAARGIATPTVQVELPSR